MKASIRSRSDSPRGMETVGLDIGETNKRNLSQRRAKRGECPTCGKRTHKIGMFGKKTPLTIEGECVYGRCLRCKPVEGYQIRPPAAALPPPKPMGVGRDIIVDDDDSVMSGITMDPALRMPSARWMPQSIDAMSDVDEEQEDVPPPPIRRPLPSVGGDDDFHPFPRTTQPQEPSTTRTTLQVKSEESKKKRAAGLLDAGKEHVDLHGCKKQKTYSEAIAAGVNMDEFGTDEDFLHQCAMRFDEMVESRMADEDQLVRDEVDSTDEEESDIESESMDDEMNCKQELEYDEYVSD